MELSISRTLHHYVSADYQIGKVLGQGAYAVVKEAQHRNSGFSIALKVYDKYKLVDV